MSRGVGRSASPFACVRDRVIVEVLVELFCALGCVSGTLRHVSVVSVPVS